MLIWLGMILIVGIFFIGFFLNRILMRIHIKSSKNKALTLIEEAKKEADNYLKSSELAAKEKWYQEKLKFEKDTEAKRKEQERSTEKIKRRRRNLEKREEVLAEREKNLLTREKNLLNRERILKTKTERLDQLINDQNVKLERITNMSIKEAKQELFKNLENQTRLEAAQMIKEIKEKARQEANKQAKELIIRALQRCDISHWAETTVSAVPLPSDELKGRIIGREGRNIRTFETLTGTEVIIDDTPGAIIVSGFDPFRREIAKIAMEKLIQDGRIHPARIEEVVKKVTEEMKENTKNEGEGVLLELGIVGLHPEIVKQIGALRFRTSYGQNVLQHSKEVAYLSALLASELDLDPSISRRAGLLHDIGKAANQNFEGPHAKIGSEIAERYGEDEIVVNAIAAHHEETDFQNPYAFLVSIADTISGGRPGARRETFDAYIKRLNSLENIANSFDGVEKAYAIQAGREVRILVEPSKVSDFEAQELSNKIATQIQSELKYPGQIKIMVTRETRAVSYAK